MTENVKNNANRFCYCGCALSCLSVAIDNLIDAEYNDEKGNSFTDDELKSIDECYYKLRKIWIDASSRLQPFGIRIDYNPLGLGKVMNPDTKIKNNPDRFYRCGCVLRHLSIAVFNIFEAMPNDGLCGLLTAEELTMLDRYVKDIDDMVENSIKRLEQYGIERGD